MSLYKSPFLEPELYITQNSLLKKLLYFLNHSPIYKVLQQLFEVGWIPFHGYGNSENLSDHPGPLAVPYSFQPLGKQLSNLVYL